MNREDLLFLPISLNVSNKKILLIGGGKVATHKATIMARFVQNVTVIAPSFTEEIQKLPFRFIQKEYEKKDLEGFFLVYVCTDNHSLNAQIKADSEELGILTSVCDAPLLCDFVSPAIHKEGNLTIAVGSNAQNVYQSVDVRNRISALIQDGTLSLEPAEKKVSETTQIGKVTLVGFGPGNPDLLTLAGDKALKAADIIFHDDLLDKEFIQRYPAEKVFVGKRRKKHHCEQDSINEQLYQAAALGKNVVRLKGGDPMIFAHGREEIDFLEDRNIEVQVIPGVSTGNAMAAYSKIPLTHRGVSSSVAFVSGHHEYKLQTPNADTLVYYMGGNNAATIARKAIASGKPKETPVALVHNVSLPTQQIFSTNLERLQSEDFQYPTPIIIIIGDVVGLNKNI